MVIDMREVGNVAVFDIQGEIRRSDSPETTLHQLVKARLEAGRTDILLNCEKVDFIDSFGVGEILASYISTQNLGGKFKLSMVAPKLLIIFQVTMLTRVLEIFGSEKAALESFGKP